MRRDKYWARGNQKEEIECLAVDQVEWTKLTRRREAGMNRKLQQAVMGTGLKLGGKGGSQNWKEELGGWEETETKLVMGEERELGETIMSVGVSRLGM